MGYRKFQIIAVRNFRATLEDTEHNTMEKENHPEMVITRFIISELLYSVNNYDKMNKEILYILMVLHCFLYVGARVSVLVRVSMIQNLTL